MNPIQARKTTQDGRVKFWEIYREVEGDEDEILDRCISAPNERLAIYEYRERQRMQRRERW